MKPHCQVNAHGVNVHGKTVFLDEERSTYQLRTLPIRRLRTGFLHADNKKGSWDWAFVGIELTIGLVLLCAGVMLLVGGVVAFPGRETGWSVGIPGIFGAVMGVWLILSALSSASCYFRLFIENERIVLERVSRARVHSIAESILSSDDYLTCHICEDAEQDNFAVSLELVLPNLNSSITLWLRGVGSKDALDKDFQSVVKQAFDKAKEIGGCLNIRVQY